MTGPLSGAYAAFRGDPTAPLSPHSVHVATPDDIPPVEPWTVEQLYAAVETADRRGLAVVLDYGREHLYLADGDRLTYRPPGLFGDPPALVVSDPLAATVADAVTVEAENRRTVSPAFDVLVPASGLAEEADDPLPPVDRRSTDAPTGARTGVGTTQ